MKCQRCGHENPPGQRFCGNCGTALAANCPSCGASNPPGQRFCGECGTPLDAGAATASTTTGADPRDAPTTERRLVSVLFADLVGFTTISESRDPEEVRELLSRYFDESRRVVERYGGVVEKFIGDAVMALWGSPIAHEDDAERAVRAALELTALVKALGQEQGAPDLRARAGVLTGEAAVALGAEGQGMVAGDLVNTASRIQSVATPGSVLVGESTMRTTDAAISYEPPGPSSSRARRPRSSSGGRSASSGSGGPRARSTALEPPFMGRDRELRIDQGAVPRLRRRGEGPPRLRAGGRRDREVSARLGVQQVHRRARRRRLVAPGALPRVRRRRRLLGARGDGARPGRHPRGRGLASARSPSSRRRSSDTSRTKRNGGSSGRAWRTCSGWRKGGAGDQENLFAACRLFFERIADQGPSVMVFEDIHWADSALLDFIEYLVDWSRDRPDLRRDARTARALRAPARVGQRDAELHLDLPRATADRADGLAAPRTVPGLPEDVRRGSSSAPRESPSTRWRRSGCCIDRGSRPGEQRVPARRARRDPRGARVAPGADRRPAGRARDPTSGGCSRTPRSSGRTFTLQGLAAITGPSRTRSRRSSVRSSARKCSRSRPTRCRRSEASTGSSRTS